MYIALEIISTILTEKQKFSFLYPSPIVVFMLLSQKLLTTAGDIVVK